jgi:hypothetical protein
MRKQQFEVRMQFKKGATAWERDYGTRQTVEKRNSAMFEASGEISRLVVFPTAGGEKILDLSR